MDGELVTITTALPVTRTFAEGDLAARADVCDALMACIATHGTLYEWASAQPQPQALRGRAPVYVATLPDDGPTVVVRHAWHGGLLAPLTGDRFRRPSRAPVEFAQSAALRAAGIPTTEVLGYARYNAGPGFVRVDVVSAYVADTADLGMVLSDMVVGFEAAAALVATQRLLSQLARHGVVHPDLNVKNILVRRLSDGALEAMVIDVDVIEIDAARAPAVTMRRNVARLVRSMRKWRVRFGCSMSDPRIDVFATEALAAAP